MSSPISYQTQAHIAALPQKERPETIKKRDGTMTRIRRFHMDVDEQRECRQRSEQMGRFCSPYKVNGVYWGIVEALSLLGENKEHSFADFFAKFRGVMDDPSREDDRGTPWERFTKKPLRSSTTGLNFIEKTKQNIRVLQRLGGNTPYGMKLAQVNACIDVLGTNEDMRLRLRTGIPDGQPVVPVREVNQKQYKRSNTVLAGYSVAEPVQGNTAPSAAIQIEQAQRVADQGFKPLDDLSEPADDGIEGATPVKDRTSPTDDEAE